ncbi:DUF1294 domain-containing protein [Alloiococcus sp. CFN-8]|uniref:DUF1294 domain-containing protein n=1 Tax=Alloiococcus sp. CFN-8 TaxID=3416081 RepID=UPI003CE7F41E
MGHTILIIYIAIINLYGILIMYLDKKRSIKGQWRIPESRFFITALLLGSLGILLGMKLFRHKTKHWYFKYGIPAIMVVQITLYFFLKNNNWL